MCCKLKRRPDWMYIFRGRGMAMFILLIATIAGCVCIDYMYYEIQHPSPIPRTPLKMNIGLRVGNSNIGVFNNRVYTAKDYPTWNVRQNSLFNKSMTEVREMYRVWYRPETLFEKLVIWMVFCAFFAYHAILYIFQIILAVFFKYTGKDVYTSANTFTCSVSCVLMLATIATTKETMASVYAFLLELCITAFSMILKFKVIPYFNFVPDVHTEAVRYLSRKREVSLEVYDYLRGRGYVRSRVNSLVNPEIDIFNAGVDAGDAGDAERVGGSSSGSDESDDRTEITSAASTVDVEAHM